uniref:Site-specific integrase n=1 Tax=Fervidobacterium pennivorans TaxID=93466 RepID=A0A7V4KEI5_FERPE
MVKRDRDLNKSKTVRPRHTDFCSMPKQPSLYSVPVSSHMKHVEELKKVADRKLEKLKADSSINQNSKAVFLKYLEHKLAENISISRYFRVIFAFSHILKNFSSIDFSTLTQEQADKIWVWLNKQNWKDWTKYTNSQVFKNFVKWLNKTYKLNIDTSNWKSVNPKNSLMPEYLITEEELNKLINATDDVQDRLLIGLLYESGCRIGEILSLQLKNVSFNNYGAKLIVKGKTGQRVVFIVWFANLLKQFVESHPFKNDPEAPLFYYKNREDKLLGLTYPVFRMRLKRLCEKTGIKKRIHPHLFRHTRLTELSKKLPEQILKRIAGWVPDSRMAEIYLHLSARDVEESLLEKVYGIKTAENEKEQNFVVCPKCGELNAPNLTICWRCKTDLKENKLVEKALSEEEIKKVEEWAEVLIEFFKKLEKANPELWKVLLQVLKEKNKEYLLTQV